MSNSTVLCPLASHYVPVTLFTYLHNALWSHQSRGCWWDAWRHHARIESLFVYFRLLRQMNRRFDHRLPRRRPKQCYGLCNWRLSKASPFNNRTILITKGHYFHFLWINFFFFLSFRILTSSITRCWRDAGQLNMKSMLNTQRRENQSDSRISKRRQLSGYLYWIGLQQHDLFANSIFSCFKIPVTIQNTRSPSLGAWHYPMFLSRRFHKLIYF